MMRETIHETFEMMTHIEQSMLLNELNKIHQLDHDKIIERYRRMSAKDKAEIKDLILSFEEGG